MNNIKLGLFLLISFVAFSCDNGSEITEDMILGRWEIVAAKKNNKPTEMLDRLFFEFGEDQTMLTNLINSAKPIPYRVSKSKVILENEQLQVLTVKKCQNGQLSLMTKIQDTALDITLKKAALHE